MDPRDVSLRPAGVEDVRFLYDLRNDPAVVQASVTGSGVDWPTHRSWFERKLRENAWFFVVEHRGERVGYLRFDQRTDSGGERSFEVAVGLVAAARGAGIGSRAIWVASRLCEAMGARKLIALIRPENSASIYAFEKAGYSLDPTGAWVRSASGTQLLRFVRSTPTSTDIGAGRLPETHPNRLPAAPLLTPSSTRVAILCDSHSGAGLGHLSRGTTLADALVELGANAAIFALGDSSWLPTDDVFGHTVAPEDVFVACRRVFAAVVVDSYGTDVLSYLEETGYASPSRGDARSEATPHRPARRPLLCWVCDGVAPPMTVDLVVDPSPGATLEPYKSTGAPVLAGAEYALVATSGRRRRRSPRFPPRRVVVSLGSAADAALVDSTVDAVEKTIPGCDTLLFHSGTSDATAISAHSFLDALVEADAAVVAGGVASLEAAAMGVPAVVVELRPNQRANALGLDAAGAALRCEDIEKDLLPSVERLVSDRSWFEAASRAGPRLVDGKGPLRVAKAVIEHLSRSTSHDDHSSGVVDVLGRSDGSAEEAR